MKKAVATPRFGNENEEADWWASRQGREFVKEKSASTERRSKGSALVNRLKKAASVQIALRLPSNDLTMARDIAARKGIGYQTLLKMLVHEGLQREGRRHL
jgi:predicted DNA binding CopG/RHH family protein